MKRSFAFDTSSLISLGHTNLFSEILDTFNIIVSEGVLSELKDMTEIEDDTSDIASKWLELKSSMELRHSEKRKHAEDELLEICKSGSNILVTDDVKAVKRFGDEVKYYFSPHIIYVLFKKGIISKNRALISLDLMKNKRDWRSNIIATTGTLLFENEEKHS